MIVEYMLNKFEDGSIGAPAWIKSGGYLPNEADKTFIGFVADERDYYIPDSVTTLTETEAVNRSLDIHAVTPYMNYDGTEMTTTEVEVMVSNIIAANT